MIANARLTILLAIIVVLQVITVVVVLEPTIVAHKATSRVVEQVTPIPTVPVVTTVPTATPSAVPTSRFIVRPTAVVK